MATVRATAMDTVMVNIRVRIRASAGVKDRGRVCIENKVNRWLHIGQWH